MDKMIYTSLNSINSLIRDRLNISQNLANVSVTGYRKDTGQEQITSFVNEYDALSTRVMSSKIGPNGFSNAGGAIESSGVPTDVAVLNNSFMLAENSAGDIVFTRRGDLTSSLDGFLVNGDGLKILNEQLKPIALPSYQDIKISEIGEIKLDTLQTPAGVFSSYGVIASVDPENYELSKDLDGAIKSVGNSEVVPDQSGRFMQGSLEGSNVNAVEEMIASIENQRQFEINMKLIKSAEEASRSGSSLLKISQ